MLWRFLVPAATLLLSVWLGSFIICNSIANLLITYGINGQSREQAVRLSPGSPVALATRGKYLLYRAVPPDPGRAVASLQEAVQRSPGDYRYWLELGRAYENTGESSRAELALLRAVNLAPRYFEPRWTLANYRFRAGRIDQGLSDFRESLLLSGGSTGRIDERVALNIFQTVKGVLGNNLDALRMVTPRDEESQAVLAGFLARNDSLDQALSIWRDLEPLDQPSYRSLTVLLVRELQRNERFADAREIWTSLGMMSERNGLEAGASPESPNLIFNPGFESRFMTEDYPELADPPAGFDWIVGRHSEVLCRRDSRIVHTGSYALHLSFPATMKSDFSEVRIIAGVEALQRYKLTYFVKTKNVSRLDDQTPYIEIADLDTPPGFSIRSMIPYGSIDWNEQAITFTVPEMTRALMIGVRAPRLKAIDRSRISEIWIDDFGLEKVE